MYEFSAEIAIKKWFRFFVQFLEVQVEHLQTHYVFNSILKQYSYYSDIHSLGYQFYVNAHISIELVPLGTLAVPQCVMYKTSPSVGIVIHNLEGPGGYHYTGTYFIMEVSLTEF